MSPGQVAGLTIILVLVVFLVGLLVASRKAGHTSGDKPFEHLPRVSGRHAVGAWPGPRIVEDVHQSQLPAEPSAEHPAEHPEALVVTAPGEGPKQRYGPFPLPSFGEPRLLVYRADDYEEPMVCGAGCGRAIAEDETVQEIPITNEPPGSVLIVCLLCAGKEITHH